MCLALYKLSTTTEKLVRCVRFVDRTLTFLFSRSLAHWPLGWPDVLDVGDRAAANPENLDFGSRNGDDTGFRPFWVGEREDRVRGCRWKVVDFNDWAWKMSEKVLGMYAVSQPCGMVSLRGQWPQ